MKSLFVWVFILFFPSMIAGQVENFTVMFYNVENLFDTEDDPQKADEGFTPNGVYHWNPSRLHKKLNNIAKVIIAAGGWDMPAMVGMCEVENQKVLKMLVNYTPLKDAGYKFVHHESPDPRGIDVALLYRPDIFKVLFHKALPIKDSLGNFLNTRDILFVRVKLNSGDTLDIFINHWPSKYGGVAGSMPKRFAAARTLRRLTDSLQQAGRHHILIMGDLNDNPLDLSVAEILGACPDIHKACPSGLFNLMAPLMKKQNLGSHKFQGQWDIIDHIIVSATLAHCQDRLCVAKAEIFAPEFLLVPDENFTGKRIFRTYNGMRYEGGFADHLPVKAQLTVKNK